jgi:hypothetical protein
MEDLGFTYQPQRQKSPLIIISQQQQRMTTTKA